MGRAIYGRLKDDKLALRRGKVETRDERKCTTFGNSVGGRKREKVTDRTFGNSIRYDFILEDDRELYEATVSAIQSIDENIISIDYLVDKDYRRSFRVVKHTIEGEKEYLFQGDFFNDWFASIAGFMQDLDFREHGEFEDWNERKGLILQEAEWQAELE